MVQTIHRLLNPESDIFTVLYFYKFEKGTVPGRGSSSFFQVNQLLICK